MFPRPPDHITDAFASQRDLVVHDPRVASGLNRAGIAATSFGDVLRDSDIANMTHFAGVPVVVIPTPASTRKAAAVEARLRRLGLRVHAVRELLDWRATS